MLYAISNVGCLEKVLSFVRKYNMKSQFIEQVHSLMEVQRMKQIENENFYDKPDYTWLSRKRVSYVWMPTKQELQIRRALKKISEDQQFEVMKKLIHWLDANPEVEILKIPEVTMLLIENSYTVNLITQTNFCRMSSFRNSLRRLSVLSNKISPMPLNVENRPRSVTFNDIPVIYKISQ